MSLRVLGLDVAYSAMGIGATHDLDGPRLRVRTISPGNRRGDERLDHLVLEVCEELRWTPDIVAIEGLFVGQLNNTIQLAELHGCIKRELFRHDVQYVVIAPSTLKVYATGNGKADKALVVHTMRARHGDALGGPSQIQTNDEADALALVAATLHAYGQPLTPVPAEAARALKSIRWPTLSPRLGATTSPVAPGWDSIARPEGALL